MKTSIQSSNTIENQTTSNEFLFHLDHQDLTKYTQLFYAVKNVENAMRLFMYENLNYFKNHQYFEHVCRFLKIKSLKSQLEEEPPSLNIDHCIMIALYLRYLGNEIWHL